MGSNSNSHIVEELLGVIKVFSDGSVLRLDESILFPTQVQDDGTAVWKDCLFDPIHNLHLRLYRPRSPPAAALPVLYFLRGGAFCFGSRASPNFHSCCLRLASALRVLVVAPDHRRSPEHRLPAAIDDAVSSVEWLRDQAAAGDGADEWVRGGSVDFGRVFVMGDSSGGNIAHHVAVGLGRGSPGLDPVRVRGYVLMAPFFGGTVKTKSESEPSQDIMTVQFLESVWRVVLPSGHTSDHEWANPFGPLSRSLDSVKLDPILVLVGGEEVMKDRIEEYYRWLRVSGKEVEYVVYEGQKHCFFMNQLFSEVGNQVLQKIQQFMSKHSL